MTPEQHRNQAELLSHSEDPEARRRAAIHLRLAEAIEARASKQAADDWNESDHPRGQPGNAGQFGSGGGGKSEKPKPPRSTKPYAGQYVTTGSSPKENHALTVSKVTSSPVNRGIHYRRMVAQLIREAPEFNGESAIPKLKEKLREALAQTINGLRDAGRLLEAQKAEQTLAKLGASIAKPEPDKPKKRVGSLGEVIEPKKAEATGKTEPDMEISNVSRATEKKIRDAMAKIPAGVRARLAQFGAKVRSGKMMSDLYPDLKGVTPRGWPPGTSWDNAEGMYSSWRKEIAITEFLESIVSKRKMPTQRAEGVLLHEAGHAFDHALSNISHSPKFMDTYQADVAKIPPTVAKDQLSYYLQPGPAGPEEAFAELFAWETGSRGSTYYDPRKYFPGATELVRQAIKSQEGIAT